MGGFLLRGDDMDEGIIGTNTAGTINYSGTIHPGYHVALVKDMDSSDVATDMLNVHTLLPPITDPIDKLIYEIVSNDLDLTDDQVGFILADKYNIRNKDGTPLARQSINPRRRTLEKMGYTVR
jgi:hypothetical protein